jgi:hypothetical protein
MSVRLLYQVAVAAVTPETKLDVFVSFILPRLPLSGDKPVSIVTTVRFPEGADIFLFSKMSLPTVRSTQPPIQWAPNVNAGGKTARPGH